MKSLLSICWFLSASLAHAHGQDWIAEHPLEWRTGQISQVVSSSPYSTAEPVVKEVDGKRCVTGPFLNMDVDNGFAFDIDETVVLEVEFDLENTPAEVDLQYDRNGGRPAKVSITLPQRADSRWYRHRFILKRARFSGRTILFQIHKGDFSLAGGGEADFMKDPVTICDITLSRSHETPEPEGYGQLKVVLTDEHDNPVSARIGIYDASGRMPLPAESALPVKYKSLNGRSVTLSSGTAWPVENRFAFYPDTDGHYQARLPIGHYTLVATRGLEYRFAQQPFEIKANQTAELAIRLSRWADMPARGWYSGDVHIHYGRDNEQDDRHILARTRAEDLHVANLLQMGDVGLLDFHQHSWRKYPNIEDAHYTLAPGQEDPRSHRGHTIQLDIHEPVRDPARYYQYHEVFEAVRRQGGVTGYAHVRDKYPFGAQIGLALDVPYGLVDFVEILQFAQVSLDTWFDWLNLGYKLPPAAGSDIAPLSQGVPGEVRNYVNVGEDYSVQGWFEGLKAGRTFVTNGPLLALAVNGQGMGSEVKIQPGDRLSVTAEAKLNPDIARLHKLELYQQGRVVAVSTSDTGAEHLTLDFETNADGGSWFVLKATGDREIEGGRIVAVSAPVYVNTGVGFCQPSFVPDIVARQQVHLARVQSTTVDDEYHYEFPDATAMRKRYWPSNQRLLEQRIVDVTKRYDELLALAQKGKCLSHLGDND